ncbi:hypothetical protein C414_000080102 [Campylobacter jejuni subsp. jejuni 414]|nr:hypothetical protein C414_000080102 [Campylobacter jejuni subsp. jejuni 414]
MLVNKFNFILLFFIIFTSSYAQNLNTNDTINSILNQNKNHPALTSYASKKDLKKFRKKTKKIIKI